MRRRKPTADHRFPCRRPVPVLSSRGAPHNSARPAGREDVPPASELTLRSCQTRTASAAAAVFDLAHPIGIGGGNRAAVGMHGSIKPTGRIRGYIDLPAVMKGCNHTLIRFGRRQGGRQIGVRTVVVKKISPEKNDIIEHDLRKNPPSVDLDF